MPEADAKALLAAHGVPVPIGRLASDAEGAARVSRELRAPYVVKIVAPDVIHKSELGGVMVGLRDEAAVREAAAEILDRARRVLPAESELAVLVEEQAAGSVELAVGARSTNGFGPAVMVAMGGIWVEVLDDVAFGFAPLTREQAAALVRGLRAWPMLSGGRGSTPCDTEALADIIVRVSELVAQFGDDHFEIDLNPVLVGPDGAVVVDAVIGRAPVAASVVAVPPTVDLSKLYRPRRAGVFGADAVQPKTPNTFIREMHRLGKIEVVAFPLPGQEGVGSIDGVTTVPDLATAGELDLISVNGPDVDAIEIASSAPRGSVLQVLSNTFGSTVEERREWTDALVSAAHSAGARVLGPNSLGAHSPAHGISLLPGTQLLDEGSIGAIFQSGGLTSDFVSMAEDRGVAVSVALSVADAADIGVEELLSLLLDDESTKVIVLYLESTRSARGILDAVRGAQNRKPIVLLVGGRSAAGADAAASHTGAIADDRRLWGALAREIDAVEVVSLEGLLTAAEYLSRFGRQTPAVEPSALLIATGGDGVIASDLLDDAGVSVSALKPAALDAFVDLRLHRISVANPVDLASPAALLPPEAKIFESMVDAILSHQHFTDVVLNLGAASVYSFVHGAEESLLRICEAVASAPRKHPGVRFTAVVSATGKSQAGRASAERALADAGYQIASSIADAGLGIRAASGFDGS
ncbi:MAG: acetate--CoA ligase family protein [Cryobacterium sp.]|nr:acetate--CoA ligase family protein [Cryobacterium sp.]